MQSKGGRNYLSPYLGEIVIDVSEHLFKQLCNRKDVQKIYMKLLLNFGIINFKQVL